MKKLIALLMAVLMVVSVFAACGSKTEKKDEKKGEKNEPVVNVDETEEENKQTGTKTDDTPVVEDENVIVEMDQGTEETENNDDVISFDDLLNAADQ